MYHFAGLNGVNGVDYGAGVVPHQWPPVGKQDRYANGALARVLLWLMFWSAVIRMSYACSVARRMSSPLAASAQPFSLAVSTSCSCR